jgi:crossover junction endodeoxyribonuclease RuvC
MVVAGIDPGLSGALAVLNEDDLCESVHMPRMGDMVDGGALARWLGDRDVELAILESANAWPGQGVAGMFKYGRSFGQVLGVLQASLIPYLLVTPAKWKRDMHLSSDKEASRRRAIELLPRAAGEGQFSLKKDEARAEAALIAWWYLHGRGSTTKEAVNTQNRVSHAEQKEPPPISERGF